jgi:hypothetical protein
MLRSQELSRDRICHVANILELSFRDQSSTGSSRFGSQIDDVVRSLDHVEVMLDDNQRVTDFKQVIEARE